MRSMSLLILALVVVPACKKKVEPPEPVAEAVPEPPPAPEPPPPPPPPPCPERDAFAGTWYVVTQVSDEVGKPMAGINGYYTVRINPIEDDEEDCSVKAVISKDGYGRGSKTTDQRLFGESTAVTREDGYWRFPIALGGPKDKTSMVLWLDQVGDDQLAGYFHYAGESWSTSRLYGHVEGRDESWDGAAVVGSDHQADLDACGLEGAKLVTDDTCDGRADASRR